MIDETIESGDNVTESGAEYIEAIKKMKETTVAKDTYDKVVAEKKQLLQALVDGERITPEETRDPGLDIDEKQVVQDIKKNLNRGNNLEGWKNILKLVDYDRAHGNIHPFVSVNNRNPSEEDIEKAEYVEQYIRHCIEYSDGNNQLFTQEMTRNMVDDPVLVAKLNSRK